MGRLPSFARDEFAVAGVDIKTAQELSRHAKFADQARRLYSSNSATKREADDRVMKMVLEAANKKVLSAS